MSPLLKSAAMFMAPSTMNTAARERTGSAVRASGKPGARPCMPHASALQPLPGTPSRHASYSLACARHDQPREDERDDAGPPGALDEPPHDHDAHEAGADAHAAKRQGVVDGDAAEEEELDDGGGGREEDDQGGGGCRDLRGPEHVRETVVGRRTRQ